MTDSIDQTPLARAPESANPAALLHDLAAALTVAATPEEVTDAVVTKAVASFGAAGGVVALITPELDALELVRTSAMPEAIEAEWRRFPLTDPVPLAAAAGTGEEVFIESRDAWSARYPGIASLLEATGHHAVVALPLVAGGRIVGAMGLSFGAPRSFTSEDRALLRSAANLCAQALERARLFDAERRARAEAEAAAARLGVLYEQAQAANRAKDEFLAMVSHELRAPLSGIGNNVQMLAMELFGPLTDKQRAALDRITSSQLHLLGLIGQLLDLKKIASGQMHYDLQPVQVDAVLAQAASMVEWQFQRGTLAFVTEIPFEAGDVEVNADPGKLKQIVMNLLSNAAKFTPPGGSVTLARAVEGETVRIEVRDTGIGIDAAYLEPVFQPFVQVRDGRQPNVGGTGLGLAISRDFARGMGGELVAESEVGVGSRFTVTLRRWKRD